MTEKARRVVFIDRDGVINVDLWKYVEHWDEFRFEEGVCEALKALTDGGFDIFIISNQAGVGDGVLTERAMWDVHEKMVAELGRCGVVIRGAHYCTHGKKAACDCRKPKTLLFEQAVRGVVFDKAKTFFVGDKLSDIEAGKNFGLRTILVRTGYGRQAEAQLTAALRPDHIVNHLKDAVPLILNA
ncbi:MAG: HAD-IIIA family hydrolase [Candidatus Omnitrophica bacterium]|nr:HAD-IIIA family hydrolase [Candidatus Omnitrophota bacterium]